MLQNLDLLKIASVCVSKQLCKKLVAKKTERTTSFAFESISCQLPENSVRKLRDYGGLFIELTNYRDIQAVLDIRQ